MTNELSGDEGQPPARPRLTSVLVVLTGIGTAMATWTALAERSSLEAAFPGMTPALYVAYLFVVGGIVVTLGGVWQMKRWAPPSLVVVGIAAFLLDLLADAPLSHTVASALSTLLMLASLYPVRRWFLSVRSPKTPSP